VVNQTLLAVPIILLYEIGLFLSWMAWPEQGDYMFVKKIRAGISWVLRKVRAAIRFPVVKARWAYRKVMRKD